MKTYVYALIEKDRKYLLLKKHISSKNPGKWNLAGGKLQESETKKECVIREVKEETDLDFFPQTVLLNYQENDKSFVVYKGYVLPGRITLNQEHEEHGFFSSEEILEMNVFKYLLLIISK